MFLYITILLPIGFFWNRMLDRIFQQWLTNLSVSRLGLREVAGSPHWLTLNGRRQHRGYHQKPLYSFGFETSVQCIYFFILTVFSRSHCHKDATATCFLKKITNVETRYINKSMEKIYYITMVRKERNGVAYLLCWLFIFLIMLHHTTVFQF